MGQRRERGGETPAKVLVIGFDGMEATAVEPGSLPAFAGLRERHAAVRLDSCLDTFPDDAGALLGDAPVR